MEKTGRKYFNIRQHLSLRSQAGRICALALLTGLTTTAVNAESAGPKIHTNQNFIEEVQNRNKLDISDQMSVFKYILDSLPKTVKVYPTEGYYYFSFYKDSVKYAGNIRLDYGARQKGEVYFNYFKATNAWSYDDKDHFASLGKKHGVTVEKIKNLTYKVSYKDSSVVFELADLSKVAPPEGTLREDEKYLGPVYDESGVRFFLVFNPKIKVFHYILDETAGSTDELIPLKDVKGIYVGRRTGFGFYDDTAFKRKILVGVSEANSGVNNYYDGPFDQLPDSFIKGDELKNAILAEAPELKGRIDRFGNFEGEARRYLIAPYMYYRVEQDLVFFTDCITKKITPDMYQCFLAPTPSEDEEQPETAEKAEKNEKMTKE